MADRLTNKVCVITGATGIAAAAAHRCAAEGASVFTISIAEDECAALGAALEEKGHRHGWAVAGGSGRRLGDGAVHEISLEGWQATLDMNLTTTFLAVRQAMRHMLDGEGGAIVVTSSVLAEHPSPDLFATHAYAAAKGAQLTLVRAAAARYAGDGIRINAIAPAVVATPMSRRAQSDETATAYVERKQPLAGGFLQPDDIAAAALFLLSDESRTITGQVLAVDGGWGVTDARA
jgi:NAD(P)-dependent dehydrogenase (short-subunit alcohol dehydrogenase family)